MPTPTRNDLRLSDADRAACVAAIFGGTSDVISATSLVLDLCARVADLECARRLPLTGEPGFWEDDILDALNRAETIGDTDRESFIRGMTRIAYVASTRAGIARARERDAVAAKRGGAR